MRSGVLKALIIGISGQTGSYLCERLISDSIRVVGTSRGSDPHTLWRLDKLGIRRSVQSIIELQPSDFQSLSQVVQEHAPDFIFFLGGQSSVGTSFTNPFDTYQSIATSFLNVLEAVRRFSPESRVFNAASSDCFGNQPGAVLNERSQMAPVSPYGAAKAASYWQAIQYRQAYGLFVSNGIFSNHESPLRGNQFVSASMVRQLAELSAGKREYLALGDLSVVRDWGWAPEYADAAYRIVNHSKADDFVVATGQSAPLSEFLELLASEFGVRLSQEKTRLFERSLRPNEIASIRLDPSKIQNDLSWKASFDLTRIAEALVTAHRSDGA